MARKTRKEKEAGRLRREAEILRAQAKARPAAESGTEEPSKVKRRVLQSREVPRVSARHIRSDLLRSGIITAVALGIIALLYLWL